ncbi:MAG: phosphoenolpyruvate--protein phosphotransferase [Deltaproteobacteria bacterium]|nr:MAG: phosphoenolpyruvate--protein phosphotransferase [Deltaproteobacteria bacterium]
MGDRGSSSRRFEGIPASPGIALGRAFPVDRRRIRTPKYHIDPSEVEAELARLDAAIALSEKQLEEIRNRLEQEEGGQEHMLIIEAHRLMLRDDMLLKHARELIEREHINAEWAIRRTVKRIKKVFDSIDHEYFRERRGDVDFVGDRIVRNLMGQNVDVSETPPDDAIVVAHDLSPADTVLFARQSILGIVTDVGSKTSHSAIVARALEIPAVVGAGRVSEAVGRGDTIVVDGTHGIVILSPSSEEIDAYRAARRAYLAHEEELLATRDLPAETPDGHRVSLVGNIEFPREIPSVLEHGGEGIGLYRTEFLYLGRKAIPTEREHFEVYREIVGHVAPRPVTIRTYDLGGDKVPLGGRAREPNPAMGLRALRLCFKEPAIFEPQLRALLRAARFGQLRIMFPMVSGVGELRRARDLLDSVRETLRSEGETVPEVPVGIMVELPSAVAIADRLADEVDFFSIGTNDLIQYALGIDRQNREVAYLYRPLHLAILRMIRQTVEAGHAAGISVSVCGEMAGDPLYTPVLLGLGVDTLSMNALSIPVVKEVIRGCPRSEADALVEEVMGMEVVDDIEKRVRAFIVERFGNEILDQI